APFVVMENQGQQYYIREFVEGETLEERVSSRSIRSMDGVRVLATIAGAVARVHARGFVHRNLTPSNVLVASDGTPKLIGFGRVAMQAGRGDRLRGAPSVSPEIDVKALQAMLGWVFSALGEPLQGPLTLAQGLLGSAEAFAALLAQALRQ